MRLQPIAHREVRAGVHIGAKNLLDGFGLVRVGVQHLGSLIHCEAEGDQSALVQPLLLA
jgi:hypothetical protein